MSVRCSPEQGIFALSAPFPRSDERIGVTHITAYNAVLYVYVSSFVLDVNKAMNKRQEDTKHLQVNG